jgi:hypothetical protein
MKLWRGANLAGVSHVGSGIECRAKQASFHRIRPGFAHVCEENISH